MIWDTTYPQDSIKANTLDQALRNTKVLIRERAIANNGTYNEHAFLDPGSTGRHPLSQVGFVAIHTSYAALAAGTYSPGTLHFAIGSGLYVVNDDGTLIPLTAIYHSNLIIGAVDYHTQYYLKDGTRPMATELQMDVPVVESSPQTGASNPMPSSHDALSWYAGHGVDGEYLIARHFAANSQGMGTVTETGTPLGGTVRFLGGSSSNGQFGFMPVCTGGPPNTGTIVFNSNGTMDVPVSAGGTGTEPEVAPTTALV